MYQYTLAFIIKNDKVLLLNRNFNPWMGCWNGVGGKIEANETIEASMLREIKEETGLDLTANQIKYKGTVTWNTFDTEVLGLYLYICSLSDGQHVSTPFVFEEGILDWKDLTWTLDLENLGVASNIPIFLSHALKSLKPHNYHCIFEGNHLIDVKIEEI